MTVRRLGSPTADIRDARRLFPATANRAYFNTAAVGLASGWLAETYHRFIDEWATAGLDFPRAERSAENARSAVARLMGADASDFALIPSVSSAAGLVAAQLGQARPGDNVVIGQREYSSNHFPWRQLVDKGYDVRQVPFRNGGLEPEDVGERINPSTKLVAFSGVQSATGHRTDISAISHLARNVGAIVFVDGSQLVGALPVAHELPRVDVLVAPDHKFLLNAGRGMGYCYLSPAVQRRFTPDQRRLEGRRGAIGQLLRPRDDAVNYRVPFRQLDQLARRNGQRVRAYDLRRLRAGDHLRAQSRAHDHTPGCPG